jgi:hypothetical protein
LEGSEVRSVKECARRIQELADLGNKAEEQKKQAFGMGELGISLLDPDSVAIAYDPNIGDDDLLKFLKSLDTETIRRLHALMYSGREYHPMLDVAAPDSESEPEIESESEDESSESAPEFKKYFLEDSREDMIRTIAEKRPTLRNYFDRALIRASEEGVDLDTF